MAEQYSLKDHGEAHLNDQQRRELDADVHNLKLTDETSLNDQQNAHPGDLHADVHKLKLTDGTAVDDDFNNDDVTGASKLVTTGTSNGVGVPDQINADEDTGKAQTSEVPDGGWGWFVVLGASLVHVLMGGFERSNGIVYLQLLEKYERSATETAWVMSIFSTLRLAAGPLASALVHRFSCRIVCFMGATLCTLGLFLSVFAPNLYYLYFSYGIFGGLGRSLSYTPSLIIVGYYFNKRRGLAVGLATAGVGFGTLLFPPMISILFESYGQSGTFLILAAVTANYFICACLFRPLSMTKKLMEFDRRQKLKLTAHTDEDVEKDLLDKDTNIFMPSVSAGEQLLSNKDTEMTASTLEINANMKIGARRLSLFRRKKDKFKIAFKGSDVSNREKQKFIDLSLFRNFGFTCLCFQLLLFTLSFNTTFVFLPALAKEKGVPQIKGAYLISVLGIFDAISRILMSVLLDLKRVKKYRLIIYNIVMFIIGGVSICIPSITEFWQFCIISGLYGMLSGTYISQKSVVCVDILGLEKLTSSFGLLLMFQGVSAFIGPTLGAFLKDRLGSYDMAFYVGSVGIFVGAFVMMVGNIWLYKQKKKQQMEDGSR